MAKRKSKRLWSGDVIATRTTLYDGWKVASWEGWICEIPVQGGCIPFRTDFAIEGKHNLWIDVCDGQVSFICTIPAEDIILKQ